MEKLITYLFLAIVAGAPISAIAAEPEIEVSRGERDGELVIVETKQVTNQRRVRSLEALQQEKASIERLIVKLESDLTRINTIIAEAQALGPK